MYMYIYRVGCILKKLNLLKHNVVIEIMRKQNSEKCFVYIEGCKKAKLDKE